MIQPYPNKTAAGVRRAAKRLAQKHVARVTRTERKAKAAKTFPKATDLTWDKLIATAATRPFIGFPWERPSLLVLPFWLHPFALKTRRFFTPKQEANA